MCIAAILQLHGDLMLLCAVAMGCCYRDKLSQLIYSN